MIFLGKILLSEVVLVTAFIPPFINLVFWDVYILEVMVRSISTLFWNWYLRVGYR